VSGGEPSEIHVKLRGSPGACMIMTGEGRFKTGAPEMTI